MACVVVLLFAPTVVLVRLLSVYTVVRVLNVASDECVCVCERCGSLAWLCAVACRGLTSTVSEKVDS